MGCCGSFNPELVDHLTKSPFFFLDDEQNHSYIQSISSRFLKRKYFANDILWKCGDVEATFNVITEGEVRLEFKQQKQMVFISKKEKECFGLEALDKDKDKSNGMEYKCIAVTDLTVYQLSLFDLNRYWISHKICHDKFIDSAIIPISSYLQSINVFSSINTHNASLLSSMFRWKKIYKNEILFEEGTLGEAFYIVAKGSVAVVVTIANTDNYKMKLNDNELDNKNEFLVGGAQLNMLDPEKLKTIRDGVNPTELTEQQSYSSVPDKDNNDIDDTRIVYEFKSGDYFGEVSLVINIPRTATIKAIQNTTLLELKKSDFQKFIPHNNAIKVSLESVAHERIAQSFRRYKIPLFNAVPLNMFHVLSKLSQIRYCKKDEVICDPESNERALYVIAHGNVGVYVTKQRINTNNDKKEDKENGDRSPLPINKEEKDKQRNSQLLDHDGNRSHHKRMSEQLTNSNNTDPSTPISLHKRISMHLLPSNIHLLANMTQRDRLNRELIRLSFISHQALNKKNQVLTEELTEDNEDESSVSSSPIPLEIEHDEVITEPTIKLKPKNRLKQYPKTPPPHFMTDSQNDLYSNVVKQDDDDIKSKRKEIDKLNINLSSKQLDPNRLNGNTPSTHTRFHTHSGIETPQNEEKVEALDTDAINIHNKKKKKRKSNRRNSENAIFRLKITSPTTIKSSIYHRNDKLVRIADLMIPDANVDKLRHSSRNASRRGSKTSNFGDEIETKHQKIDPTDPTAFENLDFAKSMTNRNITNNSNEISHQTQSQLTEMIKKQEKEHELKYNKKEEDSVSSTEHKYDERNGMKLRDFTSDDGNITYTEIQVSVLGTGNFFGETSLMEEAKDNDDEFEDLNTDNDDLPTSITLGSKPSIFDILNNKKSTSIDISIIKRDSSNPHKKKKSFDGDNVIYRGSHTTFRCITGCVIYSITKQSIDDFFRMVPSARPWFDIMLSKYNVSLDTVLHIPRAARYFTLFLESEYAEENIHYVLSVNEYKEAYDSSDQVNQMEMANIICNHFIQDYGRQQINVSYQQRKYILDRIKTDEIDKNIFDSTQKAIYTLLERDCFPRFKQSHFFHEFLNEAENLALLTKEEYETQLKKEEDLNKENRKHSKLLIKDHVIKTSKTYTFDPNTIINENDNQEIQKAKTMT